MRNAGYGWLSVALGLVLTHRGYSSSTIGAILAVALATGASFSAVTAALVRRFGSRAVLVAGAVLMTLSGLLLAHGSIAATWIAVVIGTVSAGTQEVGPFAALEQTMLSHAAQTTHETTALLGRYNVVGAITIALGASLPAIFPLDAALWAYAVLGLALAVLYASLPELGVEPAERPGGRGAVVRVPRVVERLAALFAIDALGGGIVVQSFIAYWFVVRFGADAHRVGILFFLANALSALSLLLSAPVSRRIGMVRTMLAGHFPSNVFLILIPFMPSFEAAAAALLGRSLLSQMDIPARQTLVLAVVPPHERARAVGLTNAVRPAASALGPLISGLAVGAAAMGLPFVMSGAIKTFYDVALLAQFHDVDAKLAAERS